MGFDLGVLGITSGAWDLTSNALTILQQWLPAALKAVNDTGYGLPDDQMEGVRSWGKIPDAAVEQQADQVPAVYVSSPGVVGTPVKVGTGETWAADYTLNVTVVDRGQTWTSTAERVQIWAALIRQTLLQHRSMGGIATSVTWVGEAYGAIPADQGRTFAGAVISFRVRLGTVAQQGTVGPYTPLPTVNPQTGLAEDAVPEGPVVVEFQEVGP